MNIKSSLKKFLRMTPHILLFIVGSLVILNVYLFALNRSFVVQAIKSTSNIQYSNTENQYFELGEETTAPSSCPADMVEVEGNYCPDVSQTCIKWLDDDQSPKANGGIGPMRCAEFQKPSVCKSSTRRYMRFCMSRFEYPGTEGSFPKVDVNYEQAKLLAKEAGLRLCTKDEFNFACEGEDMHPYGYGDGFHRDAVACNIDKAWVDYNKFPRSTWSDPDAGLYQAIKSDSTSQCKSPFGVINMNGNVDEILSSENYTNAMLSGGYWSTVRNRCRPSTTSHSKTFSFYQIGFRMCSDLRKK